jgi:magnesium chelatase subunit I
MKDHKNIRTLAQLKSAGYQFKTIKDELRSNLIQKLKNKENVLREYGAMRKPSSPI